MNHVATPLSRIAWAGRKQATRAGILSILSGLLMLAGCMGAPDRSRSSDVTATVPSTTRVPVDSSAPTLLPSSPRITELGLYRGNIQRTGEYAGLGVPQLHGLLWSSRTSDAIASPLVFADGMLYFALLNGGIVALDTGTGIEKWRLNGFGIPSALGGLLYYGDTALHAVDAKTTQERWQFKVGAPIVSSLVVSGGVGYFGSDDGYLYAIDSQSGQQEWRIKAGDEVFTDAAIDGGIVYFTGSTLENLGPDNVEGFGRIFAVDTTKGGQRWTFSAGRSVYAPVVSDGIVYCANGNDSADGSKFVGPDTGDIYALDAQTGKLLWSYAPPGGLYIPSPPTIADGTLYTASNDGYLVAYDVKARQERWRFAAGGPPGVPSIAHGVIYFGGGDNNFYAVDAATGRELWHVPTNEGVGQPPVIADGAVYFMDRTDVYAVH